MRSSLRYALLLVFTVSQTALFAQFLGYPTAGVPRTPDGKPNLAAPAPRSADGKPDLSGMWGWVNFGKPCGAECNDTQISVEFINIAATLKGPLPYQPWAAELVKKRRVQQGLDPNVHCMPRGAPRIWTDDYYKRIFHVPGRVLILTERNMQYRQIFTEILKPVLRSGSDEDQITWFKSVALAIMENYSMTSCDHVDFVLVVRSLSIWRGWTRQQYL